MPHAPLLPLLSLLLAPTLLDARAQERSWFDRPPRHSSDHAEQWRFDGFHRYRGVQQDSTDTRRKAFDAAEVDPGILLYPDSLVDTAMVIRPSRGVDPRMILPLPRRHIHGEPQRLRPVPK